MRIFVAAVLPQKTVDNLEKTQSQLANFLVDGRLVKKENFHITLAFLGEVAEHNLIFAESALQKMQGFSAFETSTTGVVAWRSANIVCAKFKLTKDFDAVQKALSNQLSSCNFSVESRAFKPHATLIRKYKFDMPFSEVSKSIDVFNKPFQISKLVLFQSIFSPNGVAYKPLHEVELLTD